jgi:hypothetical protein
LLAVAVVWLCFQDAPSVLRNVGLTPQDIDNAKRIVAKYGPHSSDASGARTAVISEQELDLILNVAANQLGGGAARASLRTAAVRLEASFETPQSPFGRYVNIDATLRETGTLPRFDHLRIGRLRLPAFAADYLLRETLRRIAATEHGELAADIVRKVSVGDGHILVTYVWSGDRQERLRAVLLPPADQARIRAYHDRLVETVAKAPNRISLAVLMPPLFQKVLERSNGNDAPVENRAAILVLAFYVKGTALAALAPAAAQWPKPARRTVTLAGRDDFPKHFLISAAIAAESGSPLADAVGLYKELDDARGGSGFSFNDIGADRAGTRFGEVATQSPERARTLAQALAAGVKEHDFMPDVADLPEFLPEAEFKRRYGGIGGAGYNDVMATIEARVASRPLLR